VFHGYPMFVFLNSFVIVLHSWPQQVKVAHIVCVFCSFPCVIYLCCSYSPYFSTSSKVLNFNFCFHSNQVYVHSVNLSLISCVRMGCRLVSDIFRMLRSSGSQVPRKVKFVQQTASTPMNFSGARGLPIVKDIRSIGPTICGSKH
jgi:hypothetical protein